MVHRWTTALAFLLLAAAASLTLVCKQPQVGNQPDTPPAPMGISHGGYNTVYEFQATTTDPDSDSVCLRFKWGDGATSDWSNWVASGDTVGLSHAWPNPGSYQVEAQAKDRTDLESDWSLALPVSIIATQSPNTPGTPTGPSSAPKDSLCTFTTIATDPDGDGVSYRFDWGTGDTSAWTDWVPSGQPSSMQYLFRRAGTRPVRAQARDVNETRSAWSNPHVVSVPNSRPPAAPTEPWGPHVGMPDDSLTFTTSTLHLDDDSVSIRFSWGDGDTSDWSDLGPSDTASFVSMTHAWRDSASFSIAAQAMDEDGATSAWSMPAVVIIAGAGTSMWHHDIGGSVHSAPAIFSDGTVYIGCTNDTFYAINSNGTRKWSVYAGGAVNATAALLADGGIVFQNEDSGVVCLNPNGSPRWSFPSGGGSASPAAAPDGSILASSQDGLICSLDPNSGTQLWCYRAASSVYSSPAIAAHGTVYVGSDDGYLHAINADGSPRWYYQTGGQVRSSPAIAADGTVYVGSDDNYLYAVNPDGTLKWRHQTGGQVRSSPAIATDGTVYVGSDDNYLYAINPNGTLEWRHETGGQVTSSPAIAIDGTVHVGSDDGYLHAINVDGSSKWRYQTGGQIKSSPAIAVDGIIYVGSGDGCLHSLWGFSQLAGAPWPKFRHDNWNTGRVGGGR